MPANILRHCAGPTTTVLLGPKLGRLQNSRHPGGNTKRPPPVFPQVAGSFLRGGPSVIWTGKSPPLSSVLTAQTLRIRVDCGCVLFLRPRSYVSAPDVNAPFLARWRCSRSKARPQLAKGRSPARLLRVDADLLAVLAVDVDFHLAQRVDELVDVLGLEVREIDRHAAVGHLPVDLFHRLRRDE